MKKIIFLFCLLFLLAGCATTTTQQAQSTQDLLLNEQELQDLSLTLNSCRNEVYETQEFSSLAGYSFCNYTLSNTEIIIEVSKFSNTNDLEGAYQYNSLHLNNASKEENTHGQMSRFYMFDENPTFYYHFWIVQEPYLIHITSKGEKEVDQQILVMGEEMLAKI